MQSNTLDFLVGGGEMGARMRAMDWARTPLGPPEGWPQNLRTCVRIILTSRQPMFVWWGDALTNLYNDAYTSILRGGKHPQALGQAAKDVWREIWDQIGPRAERTMRGNEGTYDEALLLLMERDGNPEETYYTFSYSPVPNERGGTGGIICANTEDTRRIIGERQLALLRELATRATEARRIEDAVAFAASALETNRHDLPFALVYMLDLEGRRATLTAVSGIPRGHRAAPEAIALTSAAEWPLGEVADARDARLVVDLAARFGDLPLGAWDRPPSRAIALPIPLSGMSGRAGVLVVGLSPYRPLAGDYRGFLDLVASQIGASIGSAHAYEEEKNRAEMLAELDRAKTAFFSNVSHEFRTPLTLMLGPTEDALAARPAALSGDDLLTVHRNALRLLKLVNALLDFSRIEAGRAQAAYRPTDLAALTTDLASAFRSAVERAGLTFEVDCPPLPDSMFVDHDMWEKIVLNLLSNALKFTFRGSIAVRLQGFDDHAELSVSDTGTGIPRAELPHVFERFRRVQGARARTHEGSGIGLALVHELVRLHDGSVRIESVEDQGTTVTITVPRGSSHLPAERVNAASSLVSTATGAAPYVEEALRWLPPEEAGPVRLTPPGGRLGEAIPNLDTHILVADDNADMRDYLARLLRGRWSVETVGDGAAALVAARARLPDLILTDVMMPVLDGFGLLRELRKDVLTKGVPVIMLSARAGEEARVEGLEAGADDYLAKPFSARELVARVSTHLQIARLRKAAEDASRAKDDFLSTLSHELRTPLNAIVGWATLLRGGAVADDQLPKVFETIERNARVQARLIEDLLELSRVEQGKLVLSVGPVEMVRVIEAAIDAVRPAADAKGVRLQPVLDSHATIVGDADRLQQIAWNLLTNAIKFTPRGGRVQIRLHREHSYVELTVADDGQGIDKAFMPHIFERFRQADPSSTRKVGGLGLGLAIVRSLVELHGGVVTARSEGAGRGSTFVVRLPTAPLRADRAQAQVAAPATPKPATFECPAELHGLHVLVVDDEPDTRELIEYVLAQCDARVTQAGSAREAVAALEHSSYDVLVSDVGMPEEDGHTLIRAVRALPVDKGGRIPALALTAYARSEDRAAAFKAGFDMHLAKPIAPAELLVVIARLVSSHGRRTPDPGQRARA